MTAGSERYKVVIYSGGWAAGLKAEDLEAILNQHAAEGWILDKIAGYTPPILLVFRRAEAQERAVNPDLQDVEFLRGGRSPRD